MTAADEKSAASPHRIELRTILASAIAVPGRSLHNTPSHFHVQVTDMSESTENYPLQALEEQLDKELALEWTRKASLEQRGINIITASGALVTLVFAVSAIVTKAETFKFFLGWEHWLLVASLVFFVAAAIGGILTNRAYHYRALDFP